jgi:hypothetical protein
MSEHATIMLAGEVDDAERAALNSAAAQLSECLSGAGKEAYPVSVQFSAPYGSSVTTPTAVMLSLLPEVRHTNEPIGECDRRWRDRLIRLQSSGVPLFVLNVFRHVRERNREGDIAPILERIRRLDRMAADLSHDFGVGIIDIDQAFANVGGRILDTDYRLTGPLAARLAGHTIARTLLSFGLDDAIDPELQERASTMLGDLERVTIEFERKFIQRLRATRLAAKRNGSV